MLERDHVRRMAAPSPAFLHFGWLSMTVADGDTNYCSSTARGPSLPFKTLAMAKVFPKYYRVSPGQSKAD